MLPFVIFALFGLSMFLIGGDDVADDTGVETPDPDDTETVPVDSIYDDPEIDPETGAFLVAPGQIVQGADGDDVFNLVEGADYSSNEVALDASPSSITIDAGDGDDTLDLSNPASDDFNQDYIVTGSEINGDAGNDTFEGNFNSSTVSGSDGDDIISAYSYLSTISGGNGDDTIETSSDLSTIEGGAGNDILSTQVTPYNSTVYGGSGDDVIENGYSYGSHLYGDDGNDTIVTGGTSGPSVYVYGGAGDDLLDLRDAHGGLFYGGDGDDIILTSQSNFQFLADIITISESDAANLNVIDCGAGDDLFIHETP